MTLADLLGSNAGSYLAPRALNRSGAVLPLAGLSLAGAIALLVYTPWLPLQYAAAGLAGFGSAVVWVAIQARTLGRRSGQAGTTSAVTSTLAMVGLPFPAVVGAVADRFGLGAAMLLYIAAAVALAVLLLLLHPRSGAARGGRSAAPPDTVLARAPN